VEVPTTAPAEDLVEEARFLLTGNSLAARPTASSKPPDWFFFWSSALEEVGVLVVTMNRVSPSEARGFSIAEDEVPVIAVNGSEHFNGRIFTLLHEYAHLLLNTSGLCDLHETPSGTRDQDSIEVERNRLAGEMLVPSQAFSKRSLLGHSDAVENDWPLGLLIDEGRFWGVSPEMILRKLVDTGRASRRFYQQWRDDTAPRDQEETWHAKTSRKSGGDGLRTKVRNLGKGYVRLVVGTYNEGLLSTYEKANLLSSKTDAIPKLLARAGAAEND